jgi:hypothetical protein
LTHSHGPVGPEGPLARPHWTRSTWPVAGRGLLGTEAWEPAGLLRRRWRQEGGREKAQPDRKLTGESPARSAGPKEGRRRRISAVASSGTYGENGDGGGDTRRGGSIPLAGKQRAARRSSSACRRRLGRRKTARAAGGRS